MSNAELGAEPADRRSRSGSQRAAMDHQILGGFETNKSQLGRLPHILNYDNVEPVLVPSQNDEGLEPSYWRGGNVSLGNNPVELTGRDVFQNFAPYLHPQPDYGDVVQGPAKGFKFNKPQRAEGVYVTHLGSAFKRGPGESGRLRTMYGVRWEKNPDNNDEGTTPSIGAVIEVFKGWHLYGSHSESLETQWSQYYRWGRAPRGTDGYGEPRRESAPRSG